MYINVNMLHIYFHANMIFQLSHIYNTYIDNVCYICTTNAVICEYHILYTYEVIQIHTASMLNTSHICRKYNICMSLLYGSRNKDYQNIFLLKGLIAKTASPLSSFRG